MNAPGFTKTKKMKIKKKYKIIIIIFLILATALFFRLFRINKLSETSDESLWLIRSSYIVNKIIEGSFIESTEKLERHPGIPAALLMGLFINSLATPNNYEIPDLVKPFSWSLQVISPLSAARIPIAIIGSLTCLFLFWLVYKIWGLYVATIAGFALALEPFHIALSRIAHQDAILTLFFLAAIFFYYLSIKEKKLKYRYLAGIFFGLAFLTKIVALFIPVIIFLWKIIINLKKGQKKYLPINIHDVAIFLVGIIMFFIFYPAMWQSPLSGFLEHTKMNVESEGLNDTYFYRGEVLSGPNFGFYYLYSLLRLPEIFIVSIIIFLALILKNIILKKRIKSVYVLFFVWFIVFYTAISSFGKMKDRYFLVFWPILIIAAAISINIIIKYIIVKLGLKNIRLFLSVIIVFPFLISSLISICPNYYFYYNNLVSKNDLLWIVAIGRNEGIREVIEVINRAPGGKKVLSNFDQVKTYLKGDYIRFQERFFVKKQSKSANYVLWRIGNEQRRSPEIMYREYVLKLKPIHIIEINDIETVKIYLNPKKSLSDMGKD